MLSFLQKLLVGAGPKILDGRPDAFGIWGVRRQGQILLKLFDRAWVILLSPIESSKIIVGHGELARICCRGNQQLFFSLIVFIEPEQGDAKIHVCCGSARVSRDGVAQMTFSFTKLFSLEQSYPEIKSRRKGFRVELARFLEHLDGFVDLSQLQILHTELIESK